MDQDRCCPPVQQVSYLADVAQVEVSPAAQGVDMVSHAEGPIQQSVNVPPSLRRRHLAVTDSNVGGVYFGAVVIGADDHCFRL